MPMHRYEGGAVGYEGSYGVRSGVRYVRLRSDSWSRNIRPIVKLHGFSNGASGTAVLAGVYNWRADGDYPLDALLATGRTIYLPLTGDSFGAGAGAWGPGTTAIDAMIAQAAADGITATGIDLIGGSMGATNALAWMHAHPTAWHRAVMYMPGLDLGHLWDLGSIIRTAIETAYGTTGRSNVLAASVATDAIRLDWTGFDLDDRLLVSAANPDALIEYPTVVDWTGDWSIPLITTHLDHFSLNDPAIDELALLAALA